MYKNRIQKPFRPCRVVRSKDDIDVQDGLSLTPGQIGQLVKDGVPISPANGIQFYDGDRSLGFEPGLFNRRGVDLIDAWNAQQSSRKKLKDMARNLPPEKGDPDGSV